MATSGNVNTSYVQALVLLNADNSDTSLALRMQRLDVEPSSSLVPASFRYCENDRSLCSLPTALQVFIYKHRQPGSDGNDSRVRMWLTRVAPSCVFKVPFKNHPLCFICVICRTPCTHQISIVRHYREQHSDQLPTNIFGPPQNFSCELCQKVFKRETHLAQHMEGSLHQKNLAQSGDATAKERTAEYDRIALEAAAHKTAQFSFNKQLHVDNQVSDSHAWLNGNMFGVDDVAFGCQNSKQ